jgi:ferredoxin/coenzyme F420-reducing hydrogenase delta subunit
MATSIHSSPDTSAARLLMALERAGDRLFGASANPLRQLGALAVLSFWIAIGSGCVVYVFFDTSATGAHASLQALAREQPWFGGLARSLHRYAADAFMLLSIAHVAREWVHRRYAGFRWFTWITGVPLLWLLLVAGLVGYWLVADTRAQFVATTIGEWAGWLPGVGDAMLRNFITDEAVSDRLFSLLVFAHIALSMLMLIGLWVHLKRFVRPTTQPARGLAIGFGASLAALAVAVPALSTAPADFAQMPVPVPIDWFYFAPLVLAQVASPAVVWLLAIAVTVALALMPWVLRAQRPAAAVVDLANCNGCGRCFDDCPYGAVALAFRSDGRRHTMQAVVNADMCAGCGICVGACPTANPFRSVDPLITGIDLPQLPLTALRTRLSEALQARPGATVVFGCDEGADLDAVDAPGVVKLSLVCAGQLPPSFVDYALRQGAARVLIAACGEHTCTYRFGARWTAQRLAGTREPALREHARGPQVRLIEADRGEEDRVRDALASRDDAGALHSIRRGERPLLCSVPSVSSVFSSAAFQGCVASTENAEDTERGKRSVRAASSVLNTPTPLARVRHSEP